MRVCVGAERRMLRLLLIEPRRLERQAHRLGLEDEDEGPGRTVARTIAIGSTRRGMAVAVRGPGQPVAETVAIAVAISVGVVVAVARDRRVAIAICNARTITRQRGNFVSHQLLDLVHAG